MATTLLFPLGLIAFAAWFSFVTFMLAWMGGWWRLSEYFATKDWPWACTKWFAAGRFGWVNYNNCLGIALRDEGIYLRMLPIFRAGHHPLLIPWSAVESVTLEGSWWSWTPVSKIKLMKPEPFEFKILGDSVSNYYELRKQHLERVGKVTHAQADAVVDTADGACGYCGTQLASSGVTRCPSCSTRHHAECWKANGQRCTIYGCRGESADRYVAA